MFDNPGMMLVALFVFGFGWATAKAIFDKTPDCEDMLKEMGDARLLSELIRRKVKTRMVNVTEEQINAHIAETSERIIKENSNDPIAP